MLKNSISLSFGSNIYSVREVNPKASIWKIGIKFGPLLDIFAHFSAPRRFFEISKGSKRCVLPLIYNIFPDHTHILLGPPLKRNKKTGLCSFPCNHLGHILKDEIPKKHLKNNSLYCGFFLPLIEEYSELFTNLNKLGFIHVGLVPFLYEDTDEPLITAFLVKGGRPNFSLGRISSSLYNFIHSFGLESHFTLSYHINLSEFSPFQPSNETLLSIPSPGEDHFSFTNRQFLPVLFFPFSSVTPIWYLSLTKDDFKIVKQILFDIPNEILQYIPQLDYLMRIFNVKY